MVARWRADDSMRGAGRMRVGARSGRFSGRVLASCAVARRSRRRAQQAAVRRTGGVPRRLSRLPDHDNARAIDRLTFAADNFPALGDYALFYLALAQHDQGDLNASADTLERLVRSYPDSVMIDRGEIMLADNLLKLGRNAEASAVASRLIARGPEASIEQRARIAEGRALIALGNPKSAYTRLMELRDKYPRSDPDGEARAIVHSLLASNPEIADTASLAYHRDES